METTNNGSLEWINTELKELNDAAPQGAIERLPTLQIEPGKMVSFAIEFDKPFEKWTDPKTGATKKIIPVIHQGVKKNFWLNVKNPLFKQLIEAGKNGERSFKVLRTGEMKDTRYTLVRE